MAEAAQTGGDAGNAAQGSGRWKWLLGIVLLLLILLLLIVLALPTLISSETGTQQLVAAVNHRIPGTVAVDRLRVGWFRSVVAEDVRLYEPNGDLVGRVDRVEMAERTLRHLATSPLDLGRVEVKGLQADLVLDEEGNLNLAGVFAEPGPPVPPPEQPAELPDSLGEFLPPDLRANLIIDSGRLTYKTPGIERVEVNLRNATAEIRDQEIEWELEAAIGQVNAGSGTVRTTGTLSALRGPLMQTELSGQVSLSQVPVAALDGLLQQGGKLAALLGPAVDSEVSWRGTLDDLTGKLSVSSPSVSVAGELVAKPDWFSLTLSEPLRAKLDPMAYRTLVGTEAAGQAELLEPVTLELAMSQAKLPRQGFGAVSLAGAKLRAGLTISPVRVRTVDLGELALRDTQMQIESQSGGQTLRLAAQTTGVQDGRSGRLRLELTGENLIDETGQPTPQQIVGRLDGGIEDFPLAVVDELGQLDGLLSELLGPRLAANWSGKVTPIADAGDISRYTGSLSLSAHSEHLQRLELTGSLGERRELSGQLTMELSGLDPAALDQRLALEGRLGELVSGALGGQASASLVTTLDEAYSVASAWQSLRDASAELSVNADDVSVQSRLTAMGQDADRLSGEASLSVRGVSVERLDRVLKLDGQLVAALGGSPSVDFEGGYEAPRPAVLDVDFDALQWLQSARAETRLRLSSPLLDVDVSPQLADGAASLADGGKVRFTLTPQAWATLVPPESRQVPAEAPAETDAANGVSQPSPPALIELGEAAQLELTINELSAPLQAELDPEAVRLGLTLGVDRLDPHGWASVDDLAVSGLRLQIEPTPLSEPLVVDATADLQQIAPYPRKLAGELTASTTLVELLTEPRLERSTLTLSNVLSRVADRFVGETDLLASLVGSRVDTFRVRVQGDPRLETAKITIMVEDDELQGDIESDYHPDGRLSFAPGSVATLRLTPASMRALQLGDQAAAAGLPAFELLKPADVTLDLSGTQLAWVTPTVDEEPAGAANASQTAPPPMQWRAEQTHLTVKLTGTPIELRDPATDEPVWIRGLTGSIEASRLDRPLTVSLLAHIDGEGEDAEGQAKATQATTANASTTINATSEPAIALGTPPAAGPVKGPGDAADQRNAEGNPGDAKQPAPRGIRFEGVFTDYLNPDGVLAPEQAQGELDADLTELPVALLDAMLRQQGQLNALFGRRLSVQIHAERRPGSETPFRANVISDNAGGYLSGTLGEALTLTDDAQLTADLTPLLSQVYLKRVNPLLSTGLAAERPIKLHVAREGFRLPLDANSLAALSAQFNLDLGTIQLQPRGLVGLLLNVLTNTGVIDRIQGENLRAKVPALDLRLEDGNLRYDRLKLAMGGLDMYATGSVNLLQRTYDLRLVIPGPALADKIPKLTGNDPTDVMIPITGTFDQPRLDTKVATRSILNLFGKSLIERGLNELFSEIRDDSEKQGEGEAEPSKDEDKPTEDEEPKRERPARDLLRELLDPNR